MTRKLFSLFLSACLWVVMGVNINAEGVNIVGGVYQIGTAADLEEFAQLVNEGGVYANAVLTADIDRGVDGTMIGTEANEYQGFFDGAGHTIKINMYPEEQNAALFRYTGYRSVIKDLKVTGTITTSSKFAAAIVARNKGIIRGCYADVTINSSVAGDATHGGIVAIGYGGTTVENCLAKVTILGTTTQGCGGVVGWAEKRCNIANCLVITDGSTLDISNGLSCNIARNAGNLKTIDVTTYNSDPYANRPAGASYNNYVTQQWGDNVATTVVPYEDLADGRICYQLNNDQSKINWVQTIGIDPYPVPAAFGTGQVFSSYTSRCNGMVTDAATYSNSGSNHAEKHQFDKYGVCTVCGCFDFNMFEFDDPEKFDKTDMSVLLRTKEDIDKVEGWNRIAQGFRLNMKMMNDIIYIAEEGKYIFNPSNWIDGNFNGGGHTLTIGMTNPGEKAALFPEMYGNIENLILHGTIQTANVRAGSLCGNARMALVRNVYSDVDITSTVVGDNTSGGFFGWMGEVEKTVENCIYAGDFTLPGAKGGADCARIGGFAGWTASKAYFKNCAILGNIIGAGNQTLDTNSENSQNIARNPGNVVAENVYVVNPIFGNAVSDHDKYTHYENTEGIANGELAFFLNGKENGLERFFQMIGTDPEPMPIKKDGALVYAVSEVNCAGVALGDVVYCNTNSSPAPKHNDVDGWCTVCGAWDADYQLATDGDGFSLISNAKELAWFAEYLAQGKECLNIRLTADIDLSTSDFPDVMIGTKDHPFMGAFDGQGHKITGFKLEANSTDCGLFSHVVDAEICNFTIEGELTVHDERNGTIATAEGSSYIHDIISYLTINALEGGNVGHTAGVVGRADDNVLVENCVYYGSVEIGNFHNCFGGIVGYTNTARVMNCLNAGSIKFATSNCYVGGIVGYINNEANRGVANCLSIGQITYTGNGTPMYGGAIVGRLRSYNISTFGMNYWLEGSATCAFGDNVIDKAQMVTTEQLASGEVCYKLNSDQSEMHWYQTLGEDPYPTPYGDGKAVYKTKDGDYINIDPESTLTLTLTASGNGTISYDNTTVRSSTQSFNVAALSEVVLTVTPDAGHHVETLTINGEDALTQLTSDGKLSIGSITSSVTVAVTFAANVTVEIPKDLKIEKYTFTASDYFEGHLEVSGNLNIGINGDEVYIQGMSTDFPEAWIKGSFVNDTTVVFSSPQLLDEDSGAYFASSDLDTYVEEYILYYDTESGAFYEGEYCPMITSDLTGFYLWQFYYGYLITPITEQAHTYTPLAYIESTAAVRENAYTLPYIPVTATQIDTKFQVYDTSTGWCGIFSARNVYAGSGISLYMNGNDRAHFGYFTGGTTGAGDNFAPFSLNTDYEVQADVTKLVVNGETFETGNSVTNATTRQLSLFANPEWDNPMRGRFYYITIKESGETIYDFRPVMRDDNVYGFYDAATATFVQPAQGDYTGYNYSVTHVAFAPETRIIIAGNSAQYLPEAINIANPTYTWSSSDESIAVVANDGTVTGKKGGNVTITATENGGKAASYQLIVSEPDYVRHDVNNVGYAIVTGGNGWGDSPLSALLDNDATTKFGCSNLDDAWAIFIASEPVAVTQYSFVTGSDNYTYPGRNPRSWKLEGSNDNQTWTTIDTHTDYDAYKIQFVNKEEFVFLVDDASTYKFFKFSATSIADGFQLGEFWINAQAHTWGDPTVNSSTCQTQGKREWECTDCHTLKSEALPLAAHTYDNGVCTVCSADISEPVLLANGQTNPYTVKFRHMNGSENPVDIETGWNTAAFDDSAWEEMTMPIGSPGYDNGAHDGAKFNTFWFNEYNTYWFRRTFTIDNPSAISKLTFKALHDDDYKVFINGYQVIEATGWTAGTTWETVEIEPADVNLVAGQNVLAVYIEQNFGGAYCDFSLEAELGANVTKVLTLSATGNGTIQYGNTSVRSSSQSFDVAELSDVVLTITPDAGHHVETLTINGENALSQLDADGKLSLTLPASKGRGTWTFDDGTTGSLTATAGVTIADGVATVPAGDYLTATDLGAAANSGTYTIMFDVKVANATLYCCLFNNDLTKDGSLFFNKGKLGLNTGGLGYNGTIEADTWYRVVFVSENAKVSVYLDGVLVGQSIYADEDHWQLGSELYFFADDDGEEQEISVDELRFWDVALTADEVGMLGACGNVASSYSDVTSSVTVSVTFANNSDLNADGNVDVADIMFIINLIASDTYYAPADLNKDEFVDVGDIMAVINVLMGNYNNSAGVKAMSGVNDLAPVIENKDYLIIANEDNIVDIQLDNEFEYSAFQMLVTLPDGVDINAVIFNADRLNSGFTKFVKKVNERQYMIIGFSMDGDVIAGSSGKILSLSTTGDADDNIIISNPIFSIPKAKSYKLQVADSYTTNLQDIQVAQISVRGNTVYVHANSDTTLNIYTVSGALCERKHLHPGANIITLRPGQYIINNHKVTISK